jgi:hypothetical protein
LKWNDVFLKVRYQNKLVFYVLPLGIVITVFGFIFTWTPYAVAFFISAFSGNNYSASPMGIFVCACFAKTSVMWIPLLYISTSTQFRFSLVDTNTLEKLTGATVAGEATSAMPAARKMEKPPMLTVNPPSDIDIATKNE